MPSFCGTLACSRLSARPRPGIAAPAPLSGAVATDREPRLSPDGRQVAFISNRSGHDELWIADVGTEHARMLTQERAEWMATPRWSADGKSIVVTIGAQGESDLHAIDATSGARRALTHETRAAYPSFSRDGRYLYYSSVVDNVRQLWRRNWPALDDALRITADGGSVAEESTDGKRLYFVRPDRSGLWLRDPTPGGDERLVAAELTVSDAGNWFVAGNGVYLVTRSADGRPTLARYGEDTEAVIRLRVLPQLYARSGLAPGIEPDSVLYADETNSAIDLEIAEIE